MSLKRTLKDKRFILSLVAILITVGFFWSSSRYPELDVKASFESIDAGGLGFDQVFEVGPDDPAWKRVLIVAVNWAATNKKGMLFGLLLAALIMVAIQLFPKKGSNNYWMNTFGGAMIGTPLGVCVNCAAPIASGMRQAGSRLETSLAVMISSPTLNVLVISMSFALLPWYLAGMKLFLTLGLILIGIPLVTMLLKEGEGRCGSSLSECEILETIELNADMSWFSSLIWVIRQFAEKLWIIAKLTVSLMLLAGLLGALCVVLLPWTTLIEFLPSSGRSQVLLGMLVLALIGMFLPVPMTFDILLTATLISLGLPMEYAAVLLFTLGSYSVYSFMITWKDISRKASLILPILILCGGLIAGVAARYGDKWQQKNFAEAAEVAVFNSTPLSEKVRIQKQDGLSIESIPGANAGKYLTADTEIEQDGVSISSQGFNSKSKPGKKMFTRIDGPEVGLDAPYQFSLRKIVFFYPAFVRPIASGDVHGDGYPDVLYSEDFLLGGLILYANAGGKKFVRQKVDLGKYQTAKLVNLSLVDLNNDGWLDIYFSTNSGENCYLPNREGSFENSEVVLVSRIPVGMSVATGFGDLNRDGQLDIVQGNYSIGWSRSVPYETSRNLLLIKENGRYSQQYLPGIPRETHNALINDINQDELPDLVIGNDFGTDSYYIGDGKGNLKLIKGSDKIVSNSLRTTMSYDSADTNNNLQIELFGLQISPIRKITMKQESLSIEDLPNLSPDRARELTRQNKLLIGVRRSLSGRSLEPKKYSPFEYQSLTIVGLLNSSVSSSRKLMGMNRKSLIWKKEIPESFNDVRAIQDRLLGERYTIKEKDSVVPFKTATTNGLFFWKDGKLQDEVKGTGLEVSDWGWNAKFADLDNDQWQDMYVATGWMFRRSRPTNHFFHNEEGNFVRQTEQYGLEDYFTTSAYTYIDFDLDGDLDIVTLPMNAPVRLFKNNLQKGNSITFGFRDEIGNRFGIGSKITIRYGKGQKQIKELKASGGFVSYDAPILHFGLGSNEEVESIEISWSTGEKQVIRGAFKSGRHYYIKRKTD